MTGCTFNQWAGQLWNARLHQYLLANGIAVLQLNPYTSDTWEWYTPDLPLGAGLDQPYFKTLFSAMAGGTYAKVLRNASFPLPFLVRPIATAGSFVSPPSKGRAFLWQGVPAGAFDLTKLIVAGYSSGAQMSSW